MIDRYCTNCGTELPPGATFCTNCGQPVSRTPQAVQSLPVGPARNNYRYIRWALWAAAILLMCLIGLLPIALYAVQTGVGFIIGLVLALLPVPVYLAATLWIDRYEKEPIGMLAWAFLWGATISIFFALLINTIGGTVVSIFLGEGAGNFAGAVIFAPVVEESIKALALFILFFWKKDEFDNVIDGMVYAAMVGLGFTLVEDLGYHAMAFVEGGIGGSVGSFIGRGVLSPWGHPIYTAMTGIGLGLARQSSNTFVKFAAPLAGLIAAITLHAIWNGSGYVLPFPWILVFQFLIFYPVLILVVLAVAFFGLHREGRVIKQYLTPELQSGLISQQEYNSLGSVTGRIGSSFRAMRGGFDSWRNYSRFSQVATELAFHRDRVQRGITSVDTANREAAYLIALDQLKDERQRSDQLGIGGYR